MPHSTLLETHYCIITRFIHLLSIQDNQVSIPLRILNPKFRVCKDKLCIKYHKYKELYDIYTHIYIYLDVRYNQTKCHFQEYGCMPPSDFFYIIYVLRLRFMFSSATTNLTKQFSKYH